MKQTATIVFVLLLAAAAAPAAAAADAPTPDADGFYSLFDGKSLAGWRASENIDTFKVEDGAIVAHGPRSHLFYEGPVGKADFKNFHLKCEVMTWPKANSGIFIHTRFQDKDWPSQGYEIQINNTQSDPIRTASIYGVVRITEAPAKDNQWFLLEIIVEGRKIITKVDGRTIVEYTEPEDVRGSRRLSNGTIALQGHDPGSRVAFRNIRIKPLD
jgi:hypothetical protein